MKNSKKKILSVLILIVLNVSIFCETQKSAYIHFIDVGQADSILIDYGDFEILIDAGNNSDGELVSEYLADKIDGNLEIMVATHPDADHIGGLDTVLENYTVETIIDSGKSHTTKTYRDYVEAVNNEEGVLFFEDSDMVFEIGENIFFSVIEIVDNETDNNANSVICRLDVGDVSFLFTGDLESEIEIDYLHKFGKIDVLKLGHHGSSTSSSPEFLSKTKPRYAIISSGLNNRYGHPSPSTLKKLDENAILAYRTDLQGTIIAKTNGTDIAFNVYPREFKQPEPSQRAITVYVTRTGTKYHVYGCSYIRENSIEITIDEARKKYEPCSRCRVG